MPKLALLALALAGLTVPVALGLVTSPDPAVDFVYDERAYLDMAESRAFVGEVRHAPFSWRVFLPALAKLTPLPAPTAFHVWTLLTLALLPPLTAAFVRATGVSARAAIIAGSLMSVGPPLVGVLAWEFIRVDGAALVWTVLCAWAVVRGRGNVFAVSLVCLALTKETWVIASAFALCWSWRRTPRLFATVVMASAAALVITIALRVLIPAAAPYSLVSKVRELYWPLDPRVLARRLWLATGGTWNLLAPFAAFAIARRWRERQAWAAALAIVLATAQIAVAIDTQRLVAAAFPFVLLACVWELDRLPRLPQAAVAVVLAAAQLPWLLTYARVTRVPLRGIEILLAAATPAAAVLGLVMGGSKLDGMFDKKLKMPIASEALKGRADKMPVPPAHHVLKGTPLQGPFPSNMQKALFGLGCFWGAEKKFWQVPGVCTTAVGYAAGLTPNPTYREVCTGLTGHNEVVLVVFDPAKVSYDDLLKTFWENHDPTQGMRQGGDVGTQYRSGIYYFDEAQRAAAERSRDEYQRAISKAGYGAITTEILPAPEFYYAEDYHQQYLSKNPDGYCGLGGTGVACQTGVAVSAASASLKQ